MEGTLIGSTRDSGKDSKEMQSMEALKTTWRPRKDHHSLRARSGLTKDISKGQRQRRCKSGRGRGGSQGSGNPYGVGQLAWKDEMNELAINLNPTITDVRQ